jgi:hypothetical protein
MPTKESAPLDLEEGVEYRVRLYRHAEPAPEVVYEGPTTFTISPLPRVRGYGDRYSIKPSCHPTLDATGAVGETRQCPDYRPGAHSIEYGERYTMCLLDRYDPSQPYGPTAPTLAEALEMSLDVFCSQEGLSGIEFR